VSRIYVVTNKETGKVARYVRAKTLNAAVRAHAEELFEANAATTEDVFQAAKSGGFKVLDAIKEEAK
jgi:hypothetical protein